MRYRRFGRLDWESSVLGMSASRLPGWVESGGRAINAPEAVRMMRYGIDRGVNYIDAGFPWDLPTYEPVLRVVRAALEDGYREKVRLAVTVPALGVSKRADLEACLNTQLEWLGIESVDFCLLGRLTRDNWPVMQAAGALDWLEQAGESGRVGAAGFSFHDHYQVLRSIIQGYDRWALCSVQFSYMDVKHDPGASGIRYAAEQGPAVVVTEPFKGGRLLKRPPDEVARLWAASPRDWSPAEWALRFVWNHPGVSVAVAGASSFAQLEENLNVAEEATADSLSIADEVTIGNVRDALRKRREVPCPSCRPCMPCPMDIDVPRFFEIYNDAVMYDDVDTARCLLTRERIHPEDCTECGVCEQRCAKRLPMIDWMKKGRAFLDVD